MQFSSKLDWCWIAFTPYCYIFMLWEQYPQSHCIARNHRYASPTFPNHPTLQQNYLFYRSHPPNVSSLQFQFTIPRWQDGTSKIFFSLIPKLFFSDLRLHLTNQLPPSCNISSSGICRFKSDFLSRDIMFNIFFRLSGPCLVKISRVCKEWKNLLNNLFWKKYFYKKKNFRGIFPTLTPDWKFLCIKKCYQTFLHESAGKYVSMCCV